VLAGNRGILQLHHKITDLSRLIVALHIKLEASSPLRAAARSNQINRSLYLLYLPISVRGSHQGLGLAEGLRGLCRAPGTSTSPTRRQAKSMLIDQQFCPTILEQGYLEKLEDLLRWNAPLPAPRLWRCLCRGVLVSLSKLFPRFESNACKANNAPPRGSWHRPICMQGGRVCQSLARHPPPCFCATRRDVALLLVVPGIGRQG
jgi:hypothetical protein